MTPCCDNEDLTHTDAEGERIYPELCDCICHTRDDED